MRMRFVAVAVLWLAAVCSAATPGSDVWETLKSALPRKSGVQVSGTVLVRDVLTFRLESGAFFPLTEVSGRIVGGVFKGQGRFELQPATEGERRLLALRTRQKDLQVLSDTFEKAVFLFTDGSEKELLASGQAVPGDEGDLAAIYRGLLKKLDKDQEADLRLRLVPDLVEERPASQGLFLVSFDGAKIPPAVAAYSPGGLDRIWLWDRSGPETTGLYVLHEERGGCWYSERPRAAQGTPRGVTGADLAALHYDVDTEIRKNTDIEGRTTIRLQSNKAGVRVIPLNLFPKLRISEVRCEKAGAEAAPAPFIQGDDKTSDPVLVVLPDPLGPGEKTELTVTYKGDEVLKDAGENNYYIGARTNWYPDLGGFGDWAPYVLTYRIPKSRQIVSVGKLIESTTDGDVSVLRFASEGPIRAAGFNYGNFRLLEMTDKDSGVKVRVYTNPGETNLAKQLGALVPNIRFDTVTMARDALADSVNTARVGTVYFGPLPQNDVAVTQQTDWNFGQSWPTLIYIPYMAFLDWITRAELGLYNSSSFVEQVTPHEFAHQWWGHRVGSSTYRDVWLEEGLAEFTVSLVIEKAQGADEFRKFWERERKVILEKPLHSVCANWEAGPISLGYRLASGETPGAAGAVIYRKGAFVVHMLRSMFRDAKAADPDHRFIAMLKDYIGTWAGRNPATADFQEVVERHIPAPFTGSMDWFFRQWLDGTALPTIDASLGIEGVAGGRFRIRGKITQSGVPEDFISLVPLYLELDKGRLAKFATVRVTGNSDCPIDVELTLPKRPRRVVVNPYLELLTRN